MFFVQTAHFTRDSWFSRLVLFTLDLVSSVVRILYVSISHVMLVTDSPPPERPLRSFPVSVATLSTRDVQILTHPSSVQEAFWKLMPTLSARAHVSLLHSSL